MTDVTIDSADGGRFSAYVATPPGTVSAPGMLVIQEIFGINKTVRDICDDYARRGYIAVAPDLFSWTARRSSWTSSMCFM